MIWICGQFHGKWGKVNMSQGSLSLYLLLFNCFCHFTLPSLRIMAGWNTTELMTKAMFHSWIVQETPASGIWPLAAFCYLSRDKQSGEVSRKGTCVCMSGVFNFFFPLFLPYLHIDRWTRQARLKLTALCSLGWNVLKIFKKWLQPRIYFGGDFSWLRISEFTHKAHMHENYRKKNDSVHTVCDPPQNMSIATWRSCDPIVWERLEQEESETGSSWTNDITWAVQTDTWITKPEVKIVCEECRKRCVKETHRPSMLGGWTSHHWLNPMPRGFISVHIITNYIFQLCIASSYIQQGVPCWYCSRSQSGFVNRIVKA